jgi:pimeloyl-ACP methyl ester carboxylesterase
MTDSAITEGWIEANGLRFGYLAAGALEDTARPLALCLHGFPDSAHTWRYVLPALAAEGYRAVAPWMRGYSPTSVPEDGCYQSAMLAIDAAALYQAFGGDDRAVLIGHDWGALASYASAHDETISWRRMVTMAVPPPGAIAAAFLSFDQLQKSWYMFFFQHPLAEVAVAQDDLGFIDRLWADWSPGYEASGDLPAVKDALRDPVNLAAAIGYYRATLSNVGVSDDPRVTALQGSSAGPVPLPTLYLHGRDDGCMGADLALLAGEFLAHGDSRAEVVDDAGHFLHLEQPDRVNKFVIDYLATSGS